MGVLTEAEAEELRRVKTTDLPRQSVWFLPDMWAIEVQYTMERTRILKRWHFLLTPSHFQKIRIRFPFLWIALYVCACLLADESSLATRASRVPCAAVCASEHCRRTGTVLVPGCTAVLASTALLYSVACTSVRACGVRTVV